MSDGRTACCCFFIPPHMYRDLGKSSDPRYQRTAQRGIEISERIRGQRDVLAIMPALALTPDKLRRTLYDAGKQQTLPGNVVRSENGPASTDVAVEQAYASAGTVWSFYKTVFGRDSLDDRGMRIDSTLHFSVDYGNAFWNGSQMIYGDGDENLHNFTTSLDVVAHEMTHGVTGSASGLVYQGESGALNEHISDVFGVLAYQYDAAQNPGKYPKVADADRWLIGSNVLILPNPMPPGAVGRGVRDLLNPGTAYSGLPFGDDPQPDTYAKRFTDPFDNGGVHINSGIPNKAFATYAVAVGGDAWGTPGKVWYRAATASGLKQNATFADFKQITLDAAKIDAPGTIDVLTKAWAGVGL